MLNISKIQFPLELFVPNDDTLILLHSKQWFAYEGGQKTDTILGVQYEVIVNGGDFDRFWVKVPDLDTAITEEEIANSSEKIVVTFKNAFCTLYTDAQKQIQVSVKAEEINVI